MAKKDFKDFPIVKHYAQAIKEFTYDKESRAVLTAFPFGDTIADCIFRFGKDKRTQTVELRINDIYDMYGKRYFITVEEFAKEICDGYALTMTGDMQDTFIRTEVKDNHFEHTASNGLASVEALFSRIIEVCELKIRNPLNEELIRNIHREYLKKQKIISLLIGIASAAIGIVLLVIFLVKGAGGLLGLLGALFLVLGLIGGAFFLLRYRYFKKELEKSLKNKK